MTVEVKNTGTIYDQKEIKEIILRSGDLEATFLTFGAVIQKLIYKGNDTVLGYETADDYVNNSSHHGSVVGRYVGRIKYGKFTYGGVEYSLPLNSGGKHHSHGGANGFNRRVWDIAAIDETVPSVTLAYRAADGEEGYPGNIDCTITYSIKNGNTLAIEYTGISDKDTPFNPTNHAYFNLNVDKSKNVYDTLLQINAPKVCDTDEDQISNGEYIEVAGTPLDFTTPKAIGKDIDADYEPIRIATGHDHTYVLSEDREWKFAAKAYCPESGITMECYTDMPIVTFYSANYLNEKVGKFGINNFRRQGFCLETSFIPNSVNIPAFPDTILKAGDKFYSKTEYIFNK